MRRSFFDLILPNRLVSFLVAGVCGSFALYYIAAQSVELPLANELRNRWSDTTTMRGNRGHRDHAPRANGPIDLSFLCVLTVAGIWRGAALSKDKTTKE